MKTKKHKELKTLTEEEFNLLPRLKQRVLIAKDVIAQVKSKKFRPSRGTYFSTSSAGSRNSDNLFDFHSRWSQGATRSAQSVIKDSQCYVCAKGAAICSFVGKFNRKLVRDMESDMPELVKIFGRTLWDEIEAQFEGDPSFRRESDDNSPIKPKSIASIMQNIIENKGKYKYRGKLIG